MKLKHFFRERKRQNGGSPKTVSISHITDLNRDPPLSAALLAPKRHAQQWVGASPLHSSRTESENVLLPRPAGAVGPAPLDPQARSRGGGAALAGGPARARSRRKQQVSLLSTPAPPRAPPAHAQLRPAQFRACPQCPGPAGNPRALNSQPGPGWLTRHRVTAIVCLSGGSGRSPAHPLRGFSEEGPWDPPGAQRPRSPAEAGSGVKRKSFLRDALQVPAPAVSLLSSSLVLRDSFVDTRSAN